MYLIILKHVHFFAAGSGYVDHDLVLEVLPALDGRILLGVYSIVHILMVRGERLRYDVAGLVGAQEEVTLHGAFGPQSRVPHEGITQELLGGEPADRIHHEHLHQKGFGLC